jgi:hypothetical protein
MIPFIEMSTPSRRGSRLFHYERQKSPGVAEVENAQKPSGLNTASPWPERVEHGGEPPLAVTFELPTAARSP